MIARMSVSRCAAVLVLAGSLAVIATFLAFEYALGYLPCPLCLQQRVPYYAAAPLAALIALLPEAQRRIRAIGLTLLVLTFLVSIGLGAFHAGVEWGFWPGPAGCSGQGTPQDAAGLLAQLQDIRVVSCTDAAWRLFGLSMAGWNVLTSLALAAIALVGVWRISQRPAPASRKGAP